MLVRVLGPIVVEERQQRIDVWGERQRTVLALLCVRWQDGISAEELVDELWDRRPPTGALISVRSYLARLRRVLDGDRRPSVVSSARGLYRLELDHVEIDAVAFERELRRPRGHQVPPTERAQQLGDALARWRGRPYGGTAPTRALVGEASRLEELYVDAVEERVRADVDCARHRSVIPELQKLTSEHPFREHLWELLIVALYRSGRQTDALRAAHAYRQRLRDDLGTDPGRDLDRLERAILLRDPLLDGEPWLAVSATVREHYGEERAPGPLDDLDLGRAALAAGSFESADAHFQHGLDSLGAPTPPGSEDRACELLLGLSRAKLGCRDITGAGDAALAAADIARVLRTPEALGRAAVAGSYLNSVGHVSPAIATLCSEALERLGDSHPGLRALILAGQADLQGFGEGHGDDGIVTSRLALGLARASGEREAIHRCLFVHAEALGWTPNVGERLLLAESLLKEARHSGDLGAECDALHVRALARLTLGDTAGWERDRLHLERLVPEVGYWYPSVFLPLWQGTAALLLGRLGDAEGAVAHVLGTASHEPNIQNLGAGQLFFLRRAQGRLVELLPVLDQHAQRESSIVAFVAALALCRLESGDTDGARRELESLVSAEGVAAPHDLSWTTTLCLLAEVAAGVGDRFRAAVLLKNLEPYHGQLAVLAKGIACPGAIDRYIALLAGVLGDEETASAARRSAGALEQRAEPAVFATWEPSELADAGPTERTAPVAP